MSAITAKSTSAMSARDRSSAFPEGSISSGAPAASSTRRRSGSGCLQAGAFFRIQLSPPDLTGRPGKRRRLLPNADACDYWTTRFRGWRRPLMSVGRASIALHPCQLVGMKVAVAEQFLADRKSVHEEADVELVGHAHAAV